MSSLFACSFSLIVKKLTVEFTPSFRSTILRSQKDEGIVNYPPVGRSAIIAKKAKITWLIIGASKWPQSGRFSLITLDEIEVFHGCLRLQCKTVKLIVHKEPKRFFCLVRAIQLMVFFFFVEEKWPTGERHNEGNCFRKDVWKLMSSD